MHRERIREVLFGQRCRYCPGITCFNAGLLTKVLSLADRTEREVFVDQPFSLLTEPSLIQPMSINECKRKLKVDPRINAGLFRSLAEFHMQSPGFSWKELFPKK